MRRLFLIVALTAATLALPPLPHAAACSCAAVDVREQLPEVDGAFVGTLLSHDEPQPVNGLVSSETLVAYRFEVERVVKGPLPSSGTIEVWASWSGASCGIEIPPGQRTGLLLRRDGDRWISGLCRQVDPDVLIRAGQPLPPPPGQAPPAVVVGTTHGPGRILSLDGLGRVVGYGPGDGTVTDVAFCPGGTKLAEAYATPGRHVYHRAGVAVRSTADLAIAWERFLMADEQRYLAVADVACRGRGDGPGDVLALVVEDFHTETETRHEAEILAFSPTGAPRRLWRGAATHGTFTPDGRAAYVNAGPDGRTLVQIDLTGPAESPARTVVELPAGMGPMAIAPTGRHLAGVTTHESGVAGSPPSQAVLVDLAVAPPRVIEAELGPLGRYTAPLWITPDRILFAPNWNDHPVRIFDLTLREVGSWSGWGASHVTVVGDHLVGLSGPKVVTAPVATGPPSEWADLESGVPGMITRFPDGALIGQPGRPSSPATTQPAAGSTTTERPPPTTMPTPPDGSEGAPEPSSTTAAPPDPAEPTAGDMVVVLPARSSGRSSGRPLLAGGAGAALLAAGLAGFIRRRVPKST